MMRWVWSLDLFSGSLVKMHIIMRVLPVCKLSSVRTRSHRLFEFSSMSSLHWHQAQTMSASIKNYTHFYAPPIVLERVQFTYWGNSRVHFKRRTPKDEKCSIVMHSFCFEMNLRMLNRSCSSNVGEQGWSEDSLPKITPLVCLCKPPFMDTRMWLQQQNHGVCFPCKSSIRPCSPTNV